MAKKKEVKPNKKWVCTNCKHFSWDEKNGFWKCTGFGITTRVARPEIVTACSHRDAGEPFDIPTTTSGKDDAVLRVYSDGTKEYV